MSDVETPPAANGAATDADVDITSPPLSSDHPDSTTVIPKLMSKIQLLEQDLVNGQLKIKNLEDEISSHESDKRALTSIASRASDLETEVSRLQHDLIASMSDAQEANAEASDLKRRVAEFESKERESVEKVKVIEIERNLLLEKVKESEEKARESETESARKIEALNDKISGFEAKERENEEKISLLVEKLEEIKEKERVKTERIDALMEKLKESESKISELESEGKNKNVKVNEMLEKLDVLQKEIVSKEVETSDSASTTNWPVIAVSAGAVVTLALVYFRHAKF